MFYTLHELIRDTELHTPPRRFMIPEALLSHFDQMPALPIGLLPLGDIIGSFNPLQAQGMTIAVLHAKTLGETLTSSGADDDDLAGFSKHYIKAVVQISEAAWRTAVNVDYSYSQTTGERPADLTAQQIFRRAVREIMQTDTELHSHAVHVFNMLSPGSVLARPDVIARAEAIAAGETDL
jgi:hypothetical protein